MLEEAQVQVPALMASLSSLARCVTASSLMVAGGQVLVPVQTPGRTRGSSQTNEQDLSPIEAAKRRKQQAASPSSPEHLLGRKRLPKRRSTQGRKRRALQAPRHLADPLDSVVSQAALRQRCNAANAAMLAGKTSELRTVRLEDPLEQVMWRMAQPSAGAEAADVALPCSCGSTSSCLQLVTGDQPRQRR